MNYYDGPPRPSRDPLSLFATVTRFWQWGCSLSISIAIALLFRQTRVNSPRAKAIQPLVLVSLAYSTAVAISLCLFLRSERLKRGSWPIFAMMSIPGDLLMLSVFVAKVAVLSMEYFECSVLLRAHTIEYLVPQDTRERILTMVGGPHTTSGHPQCHFPKELYSLTIVSIYSYIMSLLFTSLQLWRYHRARPMAVGGPHLGDVSRCTYQSSIAGAARSSAPNYGLRAGPRGPTPAPSVEINHEPKYANMPEGIMATMTVSRYPRYPSHAASAVNPDTHMLPFGAAPCGEPPAYTSRPPSPTATAEP